MQMFPIVGIALLLIGFNDLSTFTIPTTILGMLGLTQVVYVGGKLVAPPSCKDLNDGIKKLRPLETAYLAKLHDKTMAPTTEAEAGNVGPEFDAMKTALESVTTMYRSVMGKPYKSDKLGPLLTASTYLKTSPPAS